MQCGSLTRWGGVSGAGRGRSFGWRGSFHQDRGSTCGHTSGRMRLPMHDCVDGGGGRTRHESNMSNMPSQDHHWKGSQSTQTQLESALPERTNSRPMPGLRAATCRPRTFTPMIPRPLTEGMESCMRHASRWQELLSESRYYLRLLRSAPRGVTAVYMRDNAGRLRKVWPLPRRTRLRIRVVVWLAGEC